MKDRKTESVEIKLTATQLNRLEVLAIRNDMNPDEIMVRMIDLIFYNREFEKKIQFGSEIK